jgi:hypothetical protein
MTTVLGLSMTSTGVGWVLRDQADAAGRDFDASDSASDFVRHATAEDDISPITAAVQNAQTIAASSGNQLTSIHLTWSDDVAEKAPPLLKMLPELGFDDIAPVKLKEATRTWALDSSNALGYEKCAVCLIEDTGVTVLTVGYGTVRTAATTQMADRADELCRWIAGVFADNRLDPDGMLLAGVREDVEPLASRLETMLAMPIVTPDHPELALARGAAMATAPPVETIPVGVAQQTVVGHDKRFQQRLRWSPTALLSQVADRPQIWASALAACAVAGVVASFGITPDAGGHYDTRPTVDRPDVKSASLSDSSAPAAPAPTPASVVAPPSPPPPPPPAPTVPRSVMRPSAGAPAYPAPSAPPTSQVTLPSMSETVDPTTARPTVDLAPTSPRPESGSHPGGTEPKPPFSLPDFSSGEDPTDDPGSEPGGGDDPGGGSDPGGGNNPGGGDNPGNGPNPGGGGDNPGGGEHGNGGGQDGGSD